MPSPESPQNRITAWANVSFAFADVRVAALGGDATLIEMLLEGR
jgi:hypothetical protein